MYLNRAMPARKQEPGQTVRPEIPPAGLFKIVRLKTYESFRSQALVFLVLYNILLVAANSFLVFQSAIGQILTVAAILAGAIAVFLAISFVENIQHRFRNNRMVTSSIRAAAEQATEPEAIGRFLKTSDGQLAALAVALFILIVVQFWTTLH